MESRIKVKTLVLSLVCLWACGQPDHLDKEGLTNYIRDEANGLSQKKNFGDYEVRLDYRPTGLLVAQELGDSPQHIKDGQLEQLRKKYKGQYYFILSLSRSGKEALSPAHGGQLQQFSDNLQNLAFRMGEFVNLTTSSRDTIAVADYVFPRTYGMAGKTQLMFAFDREKAINTEWVQFNMSELGLGIGRKYFRFRTADLEKVPDLKVGKH